MIRFALTFLFFYFIQFAFCEAQVNKNIAIYDSFWNKYNLEAIEEYNLVDLREDQDSLFIRIRYETLSNINEIIEIRFADNKWQCRQINYGTWDSYQIYFGFKIFKIRAQIRGLKRPESFTWLTCFEPTKSWDSILNDFKRLDIYNLKDQSQLDSSEGMVEDGIQYLIELSTPKTYKFIVWSNPDYAPKKSEEVNKMLAFAKLLNENFRTCYDWKEKKYKKTRWP
jgi:hypothetical protein